MCIRDRYNVAAIAGEFSLSFYNNAGFSYIINTGGDVLIRSPHPGSNKTVKNLSLIHICFDPILYCPSLAALFDDRREEFSRVGSKG